MFCALAHAQGHLRRDSYQKVIGPVVTEKMTAKYPGMRAERRGEDKDSFILLRFYSFLSHHDVREEGWPTM